MPPAVRQFFVGGEVDPRLFGRTDLSRYQVSCAPLRNFLLTPGGAAQNRPGTKLIREVKDSSKITRVVPFVFNSEQAYVIELGDQYMRFHRDEETVLAAGASADSKHTGGTHATIMTDAGAAFTVDGLIGSPKIGSKASVTLRVDTPKTKQAKIMRSMWPARRA